MARKGRSQVIADLIASRGWTRGAELGVYEGQTLFYLLERFPKLTMFGVDHWKRTGGTIQNRDTGEAPYANKPMEKIRDKVFCEGLRYGKRCRLLEMSTVIAAAFVPNGSLDFVFVDADHSTDAVTGDIQVWYPKLKPTGALLGHDVNWPSVQRALEVTLDHWIELDANVWFHDLEVAHPDQA